MRDCRRAILLVALMCACSGSSDRSLDSSLASSHKTALARAVDSVLVSATALKTSTDSAVSIVRDYYRAIDDRRFGAVYILWSDSGRASKQSLSEFTRGFDETAHVSLSTGVPGDIGAAADRAISRFQSPSLPQREVASDSVSRASMTSLGQWSMERARTTAPGEYTRPT